MERYKVIDIFPVKGFRIDTNVYGTKINKEADHLFKRYYNNTIEKEKTYGNEVKIALVNKMEPHSLYDCMFIDSNRNFKNSIYEYDKNIIEMFWTDILNIEKKLIDIYKSENIKSIALTYNFDPCTYDRESIMSEKRFHLHIIMRTENDIELAKALVKSENKVDKFYYDRIVDKAYEFTVGLLYDEIKNDSKINLPMHIDRKRDIQNNLPLGLKWDFNKNWEAVKDFLVGDLCKIHKLIIKCYGDFMSEFFIGKSGMWKRPILNKERLLSQNVKYKELLSNYSEKQICSFRNIFDDFSIDYSSLDRKYLISNYPLAGPAYSFSLFYDIIKERIIMAIHPKVFSDMGGAGVTWFGETNAIRIKRGVGYFTTYESKIRSDFIRHVRDSFY